MANLNKVMLIGRLTRDPEVRTFANGGKIAKIGFAVNNRRKNASTGQYEEVPVFVDIDAFNWERRKLADLVEQYLRKGSQVYIEGNLVLDQWTSQDGQKRSKLKVTMTEMQFLGSRTESGGAEGSGRGPYPQEAPREASMPPPGEGLPEEPVPDSYGPPPAGGEAEIPF